MEQMAPLTPQARLPIRTRYVAVPMPLPILLVTIPTRTSIVSVT